MSSRNIEDCVQELRDKWPLLADDFTRAFPGYSLELTCTHRTPEEQFSLFQKGRRKVGDSWVVDDAAHVVTQIDGQTRLSNHNHYPARAFDVAIKQPDGSLTWDLSHPAWKALPDIVAALNLISGGAWAHWRDYPHVEIAQA